ncbi:hypothetical protein [Sulfurisoma sediminicola]|uniref:SpoIIAA-like protein n=1 Tax=Sulfurisoma sediminicola TaxID=1381557 RepID=A0A497X7G6_9PROT|nr:hypothetical protein [Sulfurisoma sediminicola]RLJ61640.1 hypothetical protein DFR35_2844 [Sulfurisoma sediminicola]
MGNYRIDCLDDDRVVRIITEGRQGPAEHAVWIREGLAEAGRRGCRKFIVDHRRMELDFAFIEIYEWPRQLKAMGVEAGMRVAIVIAATDPKTQDYRFFEDVAFNNGLPLMRLFSDYDPALNWLREG